MDDLIALDHVLENAIDNVTHTSATFSVRSNFPYIIEQLNGGTMSAGHCTIKELFAIFHIAFNKLTDKTALTVEQTNIFGAVEKTLNYLHKEHMTEDVVVQELPLVTGQDIMWSAAAL